MALIQSLVTSDKYGVKCPYTMTPKGICIHNTANDASAKNEISYMKSNNNEVSFHIAIDDVEAIQAIPFNRNAWAAGDGGSGDGNRNYIHIEICYSKSGGSKFTAAEKRAAKEVAALLKSYKWGIGNVKKHQDFSGKYCPHRTLDMGWQRFLNMVSAELNASAPAPAPSNQLYRIRKSWDDAASQKGAYSNRDSAIAECKKYSGYSVYDWNGTKIYPTPSFSSYKVRVTADVLNVRDGAGTNYKVNTTIKEGEVYTIIGEKNGWGQLKSGAGWVSLEYTKRV